MDVQQRIARLEGLLARVLQRRGQARAAAVPENGLGAAARPAPSPAPPEAVQDDIVDLLDDDIVEIRESAAPPPARVEPPPPPSRIAPMVLEQLPAEAEAVSGSVATSAVPLAHEPEPSRPPPAEATSWPSSIPPRAEPAETSFGDSEPPIPVQAQRPGFGLDFDDEEEPPASSRRAIASSMDEALADAAAREVPLQTPPPESGPQEAVILPKSAALPEPDIDEAPPGAAEASQLAEGLPTSAQLGNTVSLEEGGAVDFEVEVPVESGQKESAPPPPSEDFEIRLPPREAGGTYDSNLAPPPEAQSELEAHRERAHAAAIAEAALEARHVEADAGPDETETFERAALPQVPVTSVTGAPQRFRPGSFLELLDASLKLGKD